MTAMRKIVVAALLAALAPCVNAQRAVASPAHSITGRSRAVPPAATVRGGNASADFASFRSFRHSDLPGSLLYPFGWFPDSSYPDNSPPPNGDLSPARPDLLLQALSSLGTNLGSGQQPSKPDSESLLIELQGDRYVTLPNGQPPTNSLEAGVSQASREGPQLTVIPHSGGRGSPQTTITVHDLPPVTLLFRDGHREDVRDYTIANGIIYARGDFYIDGYWNKKIELSALDLPETLKSNQARGVRFVLPNSPDEVITRP